MGMSSSQRARRRGDAREVARAIVGNPQASLFVTVATLGIIAMALALTSSVWIGWGPSAFVAPQNLACLIASVAGALVFAWRSLAERAADEAREKSHQLERGMRKPSRRLSPGIVLAAILWGAVFTLIPTLAVLALSLVHWGVGDAKAINPLLWILWSIGTWAFISSLAIGGAVLTFVINNALAVGIAGVIAYLIAWWTLVFGVSASIPALGGYIDTPWFFYEPTLASAGLRAILWLGVGIIMPAIGERSLTWASGGVLVAVLALAGGISNNGRVQPVETAFGASCVGENPKVCTPRPFATSLSALQAQLAPGVNLLPSDMIPSVVGTHRFVESDVSTATLLVDPSDREALPSNRPNLLNTVGALGMSEFVAPCGGFSKASGTNLAAYLAFVSLATDGEVNLNRIGAAPDSIVPDTEAVRAALPEAREKAALSPSEFTAWLASNRTEIANCG
ncbi:hypothetical protein DHOM_05920 [Dermabacter hominis 1368]|uniref:ABC transporter permease n=2 Tax=Dermabacteraceae TaxID=85020 RepID=A0ABR4SK12_9MICO|nr:hypothetical protein DHOM_05920 [Dermabacter hominis 1368]OFT19913.1 hypothetical protein HMPREF3176_08955 [Dermabacter sp. HMSC08H10]